MGPGAGSSSVLGISAPFRAVMIGAFDYSAPRPKRVSWLFQSGMTFDCFKRVESSWSESCYRIEWIVIFVIGRSWK